MTSILLVFATVGEAKSTLHAVSAKAIQPNLYKYDQGRILITGMGPLAACQAISAHASPDEEVWNLGMSGALNLQFPAETIVDIGQVTTLPIHAFQLDEHAEAMYKQLHPTITLNHQDVRLVTTPFPVRGPTQERLGQDHDLVDMEGYVIAWAAQRLGIPCRLTKIVSDLAEDANPAAVQNQVARCSKLLAEHIAS